MAQKTTRDADVNVADVLGKVTDIQRRQDAEALLPLFTRVTGFEPAVWAGSIIGFGRNDYTYASGHSGSWFATGFSPRKAAMSIYIMPGYQDLDSILARLGKHKMGKSCLYVNRLDQIDLDVLAELVETGLSKLAELWDIHPV